MRNHFIPGEFIWIKGSPYYRGAKVIKIDDRRVYVKMIKRDGGMNETITTFTNDGIMLDFLREENYYE